ncbi:hypothetical protein [Limobrevibacterium gyesilva]|uniref:Uncharacterized protein n=1 Tax=Limobrevibacterium gyesilva TaxID=2991712 RepID=A0AA41YM26_9PROT|nr:hypothetical protein [Limobrevibacterium gyesilva]MCW3476391.1 hypothetical protein [Limobrevibacterium gyesilva]
MTDIVSGGEVISVDDSLNQYKRNCTESAEEPRFGAGSQSDL